MCRRPDKVWQRGSAAIEFALVLPLLLIIMIGTLYFGYLYVLDIAVTHAAQQAAVSAVSVEPAGEYASGYWSRLSQVVQNTAENSLEWLAPAVGMPATSVTRAGGCIPSDGGSGEEGGSSLSGALTEIRVTLSLAGSSAFLPQITLPPLGKIPPAAVSKITGVACVVL